MTLWKITLSLPNKQTINNLFNFISETINGQGQFQFIWPFIASNLKHHFNINIDLSCISCSVITLSFMLERHIWDLGPIHDVSVDYCTGCPICDSCNSNTQRHSVLAKTMLQCINRQEHLKRIV